MEGGPSMTPQFALRPTRALLALGALGAGVGYVTAGPLTAHAAGDGTATLALNGSTAGQRIAYGHAAAVSGHLADGQAGESLALEYEPAGATQWTTVASATSGAG